MNLQSCKNVFASVSIYPTILRSRPAWPIRQFAKILYTGYVVIEVTIKLSSMVYFVLEKKYAMKSFVQSLR